MGEDVKKDWSTEQLAQEAGVSRQYVVKLLNLGRIKGHKVGRAWIIRDLDARIWLEEMRKRSG